MPYNVQHTMCLAEGAQTIQVVTEKDGVFCDILVQT